MKKPITTTKKSIPKASAKKPVTANAKQVTPKKPSPEKKAPKKAQAVSTKPVAAKTEVTIAERMGLTAGSIWHYLSENGASSVAKLVKELSEEEKIIQRAIGWLDQEGKITIETDNRTETISLK